MAKPVKKEEVKEKATHNSWGNWTERPRRSDILVCTCGNRYIKTRKGQTICVLCLSRP